MLLGLWPNSRYWLFATAPAIVHRHSSFRRLGKHIMFGECNFKRADSEFLHEHRMLRTFILVASVFILWRSHHDFAT